MEYKTLSESALAVIDQYLHFTVGIANCSIPYFNNNSTKRRGTLPVFIGKGNPTEIREEVEALSIKLKIDPAKITNDLLKTILVDAGIGIDCSGLAYHILDAENKERFKTSLSKHIKRVQATGFFHSITTLFNPVRIVGVRTFAHDSNSHLIALSDIRPGDIVTMLAGHNAKDRNHIFVVHEVEYHDSKPLKIVYTHSIAYPSDGKYGTGIRQGIIEISDASKPIIEALWIEDGKRHTDNPLFIRATQSQTELRRLRWW